MLNIFNYLNLVNPDFRPREAKIHFAMTNKVGENPLDLFRDDKFEEWQAWQTRANFERDYVVSLIRFDHPAHWLFAGVYRRAGEYWRNDKGGYIYDLKKSPGFDEFYGRFVFFSSSPGQSYVRKAESIYEEISLLRVLPERHTLPVFDSFKNMHIDFTLLSRIIEDQEQSWRAALSNVKGIYLIRHIPSSLLYVGSTSGYDGFWSRWSNYAKNRHGGNKGIKEFLELDGEAYKDFQFSILEIADQNASVEEIVRRENHWKEVLGTRDKRIGLNRN